MTPFDAVSTPCLLPESNRGQREAYAELDAEDRLASFRGRFDLPDNLIYLNGNSLGARPKATAAVAQTVVKHEWGELLSRSWNASGWFDLPSKVGDKLALLLGAEQGEVVATDTTSVNLFKVLSVALNLAGPRKVIVSERDNFPTDLYIAQGLAQLLAQGHSLRLVDHPDEIDAALDEDCAVLLLTHVNYRTGAMHDIRQLTQAAHAQGVITVWDLCHSAGVVPVDLGPAQVDFAVGCTYKYLNGGPGAPAFVYAARRWQNKVSQPLSGWWAHGQPFAFQPEYFPADGIRQYLCGTQPVVSLALAEVGIDIAIEATVERVREKSVRLTQAFIELVDFACSEFGIVLASPRDPLRRGSQVSIMHDDGYAVMQALLQANVIGDYREPALMRFGFAPLYIRYVDVYDAVARIRSVLHGKAWDAGVRAPGGTVT